MKTHSQLLKISLNFFLNIIDIVFVQVYFEKTYECICLLHSNFKICFQYINLRRLCLHFSFRIESDQVFLMIKKLINRLALFLKRVFILNKYEQWNYVFDGR